MGAERGNRFDHRPGPDGRNPIVWFILRSRREAVMVDVLQPFIEGCGPWKPYSAGHVTAMKT